MEKFSAESFHLIVQRLAEMQSAAYYHRDDAFARVSTAAAERIKLILLPTVRTECEKIGLRYSIKEIDRILSDISSPKLTNTQLQNGMESVLNRIRDELEGNLFLHIPLAHVEYYIQSAPLFGEAVNNAFSTAVHEISEAGKCIALNRHTAAVCHLMRVLELGLRSLAKTLKVKYDNKPWNYVIEVAEKKVKHIRESVKRKPKGWKANEKFYSEAITHFRFLKDSWRNYSMHVYERYDEESAKAIFTHTKAFMQHLATKLKE